MAAPSMKLQEEVLTESAITHSFDICSKVGRAEQMAASAPHPPFPSEDRLGAVSKWVVIPELLLGKTLLAFGKTCPWL